MNFAQAFAQVFSTFGFLALVAIIFVTLFFVAGADLVLTWRRLPTLGDYVNEYAKSKRWLALLLAFAFGAMVAHFFVFINHPWVVPSKP